MERSILPSLVAGRLCRVSARKLAAIPLTLLLGTFHPDAATSAQLFPAVVPSPSSGTGAFPTSVAIGDLNGDGRSDLAVANSSDQTVSVLLGNGDGTFGPKTDYEAGSGPQSVAIGDLNGDGIPDLAVANGYTNAISVLLGNGDGTFGPKSDYGVGANPFSVAIGDLNADSKADLAVANVSANTISVLLGNGDGTFGPLSDHGTGTQPISVQIADLNADGKADLAVANLGSNTVSVLPGNGDGSFAPKSDYATGSQPFSVAIGDLNRDGRPDLAVANYGASNIPNNIPSTVSVLPGNGDGTFGAKSDYGVGSRPRSVAIGELNGDGRLDLAVANEWSNTVSVLPGNGDGTFQPKSDYGMASNPFSVAIGDLNGDGRPDLAVADYGASLALVLLGTFGGKSDYGTGEEPSSVAIGDLNGDGKPDLAVANGASNTVSVLLGSVVGTFGPKSDYGTGIRPGFLAIGDFNGDGIPDLVTTHSSSNTVSVLLGNGNGAFGPKNDYATGRNPSSVATGDLNGDGRLDLAVANNQAHNVSVLLGNGNGTFGPKSDYGTGGTPQSVAIGDLNGDGKPDLALATTGFRDEGYSLVSVLLGNGDGTFGPRSDYPTGITPLSVAIGDLNSDGHADLAVATLDFTSVSVLLGNGDGTFGPKTDYGTGGGTCVAIGDLNEDGRLDLAVENLGAFPWHKGFVSVLLGNGDGTFGPMNDYGTASYGFSVAIGDLNGDGKPDLAVPSDILDVVSVLLNIETDCSTTPMSLDLAPNTLNLRSQGLWVTATLEPEPPASPADIDISSIRLNRSVPVDAAGPTSIGDGDGDGRTDLTVKFNRAAVQLAVEPGDEVTVIVTGEIGSGCFQATDVIRVRHGHVSTPSAGSVLQGGTTTEVRWDTAAGNAVQSAAVLFSTDDGATWTLVAHELPNSGSYLWAVPAAGTDQARIAVVMVESADPSGYEVDGVLGVSDRFAVASVLGVGDESLTFALHGAFPNPSRGLNVSFTLASAQPARLALYDVSGRQVRTRQVGSLGAGRHVVSLGAPGALPPGVYLVNLVQGGRRLVTRAVVIR